MCAATGGRNFHGHSRYYYEDENYHHDVHEIVANLTMFMCLGDKTALKAFPKTAAKVADVVYGIKDFNAPAE